MTPIVSFKEVLHIVFVKCYKEHDSGTNAHAQYLKLKYQYTKETNQATLVLLVGTARSIWIRAAHQKCRDVRVPNSAPESCLPVQYKERRQQ